MDDALPSYPNGTGKVFAITRNFSEAENGTTESRQNLVEVNTRASIFKKNYFYKIVAIILVIILVILIFGMIILSYYYVDAVNRNISICTTEECLRSAANLRLSMDLSINPCDNFYKYICGKWNKEHINHGWYSRFSSFETINERIAVATMEFLESNTSKGEPIPVRQSRDLYKSCMDIDALDKLGYSVILKYLKLVDLPAVPRYFTASVDERKTLEFDWIQTEVKVKKVFAKDVFLQFTVDANIFNRSQNIMYIGASRSTSPLPSPFRKRGQKDERIIRKKSSTDDLDEEALYELAYKRVIQAVMKNIFLNLTFIAKEEDLVNAADIIWNITDATSELAGDNDDYDEENDELDLRKIKVSELQNLTDFLFKENGFTSTKDTWKRYLNLLFEDVEGVTLDLDGEDYLHFLPNDLEYITTIVLYLSKMPGVFIELYSWYQTIYSMILSTTSEIADYIYKESAPFRKYTVLRSRSMSCGELVVDFMGIAVSYGIADKSFLKSTKPKIDEMLENIKKAFVQRIKNLTWMDHDTKKSTLEKSEEMISFIGFPEWLLNRTAIEMYYSGIVIKNQTYLENMLSIVSQYTPYRLFSLRQINPRTWRTDPTTVNAYNYFSDNSITIPMAILSFPIYHLGLEVLNYGAIGSVLGHELTHGFDNTGRKFDKYGNYVQWWTNKTIATFESKTECFISQYQNFSIPQINATVNGKMTLGENLADNGGLNHAYNAYTYFRTLHGTGPQLPGFENFTDDQMFFVAFGSVWCESRSDESIKTQLKNDEHCPNSLRVMGSLQNSDDFVKAFHCPVGSKMNPNRTKCRIW